MDHGWISVHRKIMDNPIWTTNEKYDKRSAFIYILLNCNYKDVEIIVDYKVLVIKRGQLMTSEVKLAERWKWSRTKVRNYLNMLERQGVINREVHPNKFIIIQIINYDKYQNVDNRNTTLSAENTVVEEDTITIEEQRKKNYKTTGKQQKDTNNNINNLNNHNKNNKKNIETKKVKYEEFVYMTEIEHKTLVAKYGEDKVKSMIEMLDNYKGATGKKYKSDYRAILSWVEKAYEKENKNVKKSFEEKELNKGVDRDGTKRNNKGDIIEIYASEQGLNGEKRMGDIKCDF